MTRGIRYASLEDLPPAMRARVELSQTNARRKQTTPGGSSSDEVERDWRSSGAIKRKKPRLHVEHESQVVFFNRIRALAINEPRFAPAVQRTHAIPNGGGRSKAEAGRLKAEGVMKGVSDIFCAMPQGSFHGLYIEMKSPEGRVSDEQDAWLSESRALGYAGAVCRSADEAFDLWRTYNAGSELPETAQEKKA